MREPGSRSRCPAHYSRPRVLVVRSPRARGARSGLLARYVGGHLALGGYADVDVRPWRDDAARPGGSGRAAGGRAVKDLRAFLARRGAPQPRGARGEGRPACGVRGGGRAAARRRVGRRVWPRHAARFWAAPTCACTRTDRTPRSAAACDLVLVCVAGDDAAGCGRSSRRACDARGHVPVLHLACEPGNHLPAFEAAFSDAARPLLRRRRGAAARGPVVVAGALLLEVGVRRTDGALVQLGGRGSRSSALDAERADGASAPRPRLGGRPAARV